MLKILAGAVTASLLFANVAASADPAPADKARPLWKALLVQTSPPAEPDRRYHDCMTACNVYFGYCASGTSQNYISTVCRPQNQRCEEQCEKKH